MNSKHSTTIDISSSTIFRAILILLFFVFLFLIRDILLILFISIIIAAALNPAADRLQKLKIPRAISVLLIYLVVFGIIVVCFVLLIPALASDVAELARNFPGHYEKIISFLSEEHRTDIAVAIQRGLESFGNQITGAAARIFSTTANIFSSIIGIIAVLVISFYLVVSKEGMQKFLIFITPAKHQPYVLQLFNRLQKRIGSWLRGQLIAILIVFILTLAGLYLLGVKYALLLALFAGIMEIIPFIGPTIAAVPAVFVAFTISPWKALFVIILFIVVNQIENYLIMPNVMRKAVGLNPVVVIIAVLIGAKLAGILGIIIAVPLVAMLAVFIQDFFKEERE